MKTEIATEPQSHRERPTCLPKFSAADQPVARVKFHGNQENFGGGAPIKLFNVVGDAIIGGQNFKDSTVTLESLEQYGFRVQIIPECNDLVEAPCQETVSFAVLRDRFEEALETGVVEAWENAAVSAEFFTRLCRVKMLEAKEDLQ